MVLKDSDFKLPLFFSSNLSIGKVVWLLNIMNIIFIVFFFNFISTSNVNLRKFAKSPLSHDLVIGEMLEDTYFRSLNHLCLFQAECVN